MATCKARTKRAGTPCQLPAMPNGRCYLHGGASTGPKTEAGTQRIAQSKRKHGLYSKKSMMERKYLRSLIEKSNGLIDVTSKSHQHGQQIYRSY